MSARTELVTIPLTRQQQQEIADAAGTVKKKVELPLLRLVALTLAAKAAGRDVLPVAKSPRTINQILHPDQVTADGSRPFTVVLTLSPEQQAQISHLTGAVISSFEIAPYETNIRYREEWETAPAPVRIGRSIYIVPSELAGMCPEADSVLVALPGGRDGAAGVWGTGKHPTTQLALALLEEYVQPRIRVLDLGTGSGILAVAAARLGAAEVTAVDVDPDAVLCAQETATLNGLADVVRVLPGSLEAGDPPYDLVVMNVLPHVIMTLSAELATAIRPGGVLITSGIPSDRAGHSVIAALSAVGFQLLAQSSQEDWIACALLKPADTPVAVNTGST